MTESIEKSLSLLGADSVYMLLHEGWSKEARGNRWHFATRWARHLPVVIVVPETMFPWHVAAPELRIPNCRILKVVANRGERWSATAEIQIAQINEDMRRSGYKRPVLWLYNAFFDEAYAALPAAARVHHVTENYYDFPGMSHFYLDRLADVARISDLNVAVSEGCAEPLRPYVSAERMRVVTNGCDFKLYGAEVAPDADVQALRGNFRRLGIFAGNINDRIDFSLVERTAKTTPDTVLLFVGRMGLNRDLAATFSSLLKLPNIRYWDAVVPERLPAMYRAADFGFMPFAQSPVNVNNGFPLKTLEMAATGLPVVSTFLRPLEPHAPPLTVTRTDGEFVNAVSKSVREPELAADLRKLAAANDYDASFHTIVGYLAGLPRHAGSHLSAENPARNRRAGWSVSDLIPGLKYRFVGVTSRFIDRLPDSLRRRIIGLKRKLIG